MTHAGHWVAKVRVDGKIAADSAAYIDNIWTLAGSKLECWAAMRQFASLACYLGLDAPRK